MSSDPTAIEQWQQLMAQYLDLQQRSTRVDDVFPMLYPNPPATEEQLQAAENLLGYRLDPSYRSLLSVMNGWEGYQQNLTLFGTDDIMTRRWDDARDCARIFFDEGGSGFTDQLGIEAHWTSCLPVIYDDLGYHSMLYMLPHDGPGFHAGNVFDLTRGRLTPTLYAYLSDNLAPWAKYIDELELGPHSRT